MGTTVLFFAMFVLLAAFNAGTMTTLQLQHYGIYRYVGRANFVEYIRANNRAAVLPAIAPAILLLFTSVILMFERPPFMSLGDASAALSLNVAQLVSTFVWQRRLQAEMAETGYDDAKVRLLLSTNWIRTIAFLIQMLLAAAILVRALGKTG
jgi:hypothetical protein